MIVLNLKTDFAPGIKNYIVRLSPFAKIFYRDLNMINDDYALMIAAFGASNQFRIVIFSSISFKRLPAYLLPVFFLFDVDGCIP
jgi:hypothetical protein